MGTGTTRSAVTACPRCGRRNRIPAAAPGTPRCGACHAALPWLVDADDTDYDTAVRGSKVPVLVDVWAPWCGPCQMVTPVIEQLAKTRAGQLKVVRVNADQAPQTAGRLQVRGIPALVLIDGGQEKDRMVGAHPANVLQNWLSQRLPDWQHPRT